MYIISLVVFIVVVVVVVVAVVVFIVVVGLWSSGGLEVANAMLAV